MRLIDADALFENLDGMMEVSPTGYIHGETVADMINDAPTVDAVPVRHGKWVQRFIKIGGQYFKHGMQCSVCAEPALDNEGDDYLTNYCPNCGAKMDAERKEE